MTIHRRDLESIHAELDGANDAEESAALRARLAADPRLRVRYAELADLWRWIDLQPDEEPPADLRASIEAALDRAPARSADHRSAYRRLVYGVAAGVVLGLFAAALWMLSPVDTGSELTGTMASHPSAVVRALNADGLSGTIAWNRAEDPVVVDFRLTSERAVLIEVSFDRQAGFLGYERTSPGTRLQATEDRVSVSGKGTQDFSLSFAPPDGARPKLRVRILGEGELLAETLLDLTGSSSN